MQASQTFKLLTTWLKSLKSDNLVGLCGSQKLEDLFGKKGGRHCSTAGSREFSGHDRAIWSATEGSRKDWNKKLLHSSVSHVQLLVEDSLSRRVQGPSVQSFVSKGKKKEKTEDQRALV